MKITKRNRVPLLHHQQQLPRIPRSINGLCMRMARASWLVSRTMTRMATGITMNFELRRRRCLSFVSFDEISICLGVQANTRDTVTSPAVMIVGWRCHGRDATQADSREATAETEAHYIAKARTNNWAWVCMQRMKSVLYERWSWITITRDWSRRQSK